MDGRRNREKAYLTFIIFFLIPALLQASELSRFLWKTFNFAVLAGLLAYFAGKPLKDLIQNYSTSIKTALEDSEHRAEEAEKRLREIEEKWRKLDEEVERIKREALENAEIERQRILKEAEIEAEKIKKNAMEEMQALYEKAMRDLRKYAADLAVAIAEEKIKGKMSPELQKKLLEKYIKELEN